MSESPKKKKIFLVNKNNTLFRERYERVKKILEDNGEDLNSFLGNLHKFKIDHRYYISSRKKLETRKRNIVKNRKKIYAKIRRYFLKRNYCAFLVDPLIAAKFRIVSIAEFINPRIFIEAMMNAFIEGDPAFVELMKNINNYHNKEVLKSNKNRKIFRRLNKIKKIKDFYNIPQEWWKKYEDLKVDELDF